MSATVSTRDRQRTAIRWLVETGVGGALALLVLLLVTLGPRLIGKNPNTIAIDDQFVGPGTNHWLGTDNLGRDLASRLAHGGRITLLVAAGSVLLASAIAVPLGVLTGFLGGKFDLVVTRVVDLFFAIPTLLIAIGVVALFGPSLGTTILALGFAYWAYYTRLVRSVVVGIVNRSYMDASRAMGASAWRLIRKDVVPALVPLLLVQTTVMFGFAILDEAALGFLGLGVQPPDPSWGSMLTESREFILSRPELGLIAGIPIIMAVFAANLLADTLRARLGVDEVQ